MDIIRTGIHISPDNTRVIAKFFTPGDTYREKRILSAILKKDQVATKKLLNEILAKFKNRHRDIERIFKDNFNQVSHQIKQDLNGMTIEKKLLVGAYFTMEYSVESAALFNPSIVPHPSQADLNKDELRVIITFRATGEGHTSSIVFRPGVIDADGNVTLKKNSPLIEKATILNSALYNKSEFTLSLEEANLYKKSKPILDELIDHFSQEELDEAVYKYESNPEIKEQEKTIILDTFDLLTSTNYKLTFNTKTELSSRIIFPVSKSEIKGLEDARFVYFDEGEGKRVYYATYTAFNGTAIIPQLIETRDFINFSVSSLHGSQAKNKGMALFPEKINGKFAMLSRQDNENIFLMYSDNIKKWENPTLISEPEEDWELVQLGNCGSPIKTNKGWLVLTHGVGAVRTYCIGALLLDLNNPEKVIGKLKKPLLLPNESERNGYVPNVLYTCGFLQHNNWIVIPYALSDSVSSFAKINLTTLLNKLLEKNGL